MYRVDPYPLWIGNAGDGSAFREVFELGIRAIVQVAIEEPPIQPPREIILLRFPVLDGDGNNPQLLRIVIRSIADLIKQRVPTLVCCSGGLSRSPVIAAAALSMVTSEDPTRCLQIVTETHPADVSTSLWDQMLQIAKQSPAG